MNLNPCPLCGGENIVILDCSQAWCGNASVLEGLVCKHCDMKQYQAVCNAQEGGCGASSGWALTPEKAEEKWNRRVENG